MTVPEHLHILGRQADRDFAGEDRLFRGFTREEYNDLEVTVHLSAIRFPDFSCNWDRYSLPEDIKYRRNGRDSDGCYSFTVEVTKYKEAATPVHDPIDDREFPNYAHVEVRALRETDPAGQAPPRKRKLSRGKKLEYRQNLANRAHVEFLPAEYWNVTDEISK
ncbi:MAG: hypothetical protein GY731_05840 [Gammaproteobacteria bacterium]|nr:hypothetical protein [Gammaproteobacteria bacterium]